MSQRFISTTRNLVDMRYVMAMYKPKYVIVDPDMAKYTSTVQVRRELISLINKMYDCVSQPPYSKQIFDNIKFAHETEIKLNNHNLSICQLVDMRNQLLAKYKLI